MASPLAPAARLLAKTLNPVTAGTAYSAGASTGLLPGWQFVDFPNTSGPNVDPIFEVIDTSNDPQWLASQRSQMLAQTVLDIGFSRETGGSGNEVIGGGLAVAGAGSGIDSSQAVDIIEADFVWGDVLGPMAVVASWTPKLSSPIRMQITSYSSQSSKGITMEPARRSTFDRS